MPGVVVFQREKKEQVLFTDPEIGIKEVMVDTTVRVQDWRVIDDQRLPDIVISNIGGVEFRGALFLNSTRHVSAGGSVCHFVRGEVR